MNIFEASLSQVSIGFPISMQNLTIFPCLGDLSKMMPAGGVSHRKTPADKVFFLLK